MQNQIKAQKKISDGPILQSYLKEISRIPLLTPKEERRLAVRARSGEHKAVQKLAEANLRFVVKVAKRYRGLGIPFPDLINEGNLGLLEAARRYDPSRKVRFISYAVWWIRQAIVLAVSNQAHPYRVPLRINHYLYQLSRIINSGERTPSLEEIADRLGLTPQKIQSLIPLSQPHASLNRPLCAQVAALREEVVAGDTVQPDRKLMEKSTRAILIEALSQLEAREMKILQLRFGFTDENPLTLRQIGEKIGISRERVRQIQDKALGKLRNFPRLEDCYTVSA